MARTKVAEVIKASEKAQRADRRVSAAQKALALAERARDKAEATYWELVKASIASRPAADAPGSGREEAQQQTG